MRPLLLLLFIVALMSPGTATASAQMAVITHVGTGVENVRLSELRNLFLGGPTNISSRPLVLFENREIREQFYRAALSMGVREVKQRWIRVVLTGGRTQPPVEVDAEEVVSIVARTPGAVAFVESPPAADSVRVVRIDGRLPGEPGYPLQ